MAEIQEVGTDIEAQSDIQTEEKDPGTTKLRQEDRTVPLKQLPIFMKKRLSEVSGEAFQAPSVTIFRLPGWMHEMNEELCEPLVVAIGPYHRGKESLQTMQEHKWSTLRDFLACYENVGLEEYLDEMRGIEAQARQCYNEPINLTSDEFVMMLLLDGCFILEFFLNQKDAICRAGWALPAIISDMLLSENQLPFFVIHILFALANRDKGTGCGENCKSDRCSLIELLLTIGCSPLIGPWKTPKTSCSDIYHLLHLYYISTVPGSEPKIEKGEWNLVARKSHHFCGLGSFSWSKLFSKESTAPIDSCEFTPMGLEQVTIQCVAELHDAGLKFKRKKKTRNLLDISFQNGIIEMPFLHIDSTIATVLWNVVAFEQSRFSLDFPQTMSSYLALMESLISTEKDVIILERAGIINNLFQNTEEAATFFNQFAKNFLLDYSNHYFYDLYKDVKDYSESTWHKHRARLMQDYFSNPWSIISVIAAGILLILTVVQTYYSAAS